MSILKKKTTSGFTLIEIMLAVAIMAVISTLTYLSLSTVIMAWKKGIVLSDDIHHGDFVMDHLGMGLRSAYYPESTKSTDYGLVHLDGGDDEEAEDELSWVKLGGALVGKHSVFSESPHRVRIFLEDDGNGKPQVAITAWMIIGQSEDFDPEELESIPVSKQVSGMNFRFADPNVREDEELEWLDEWEWTNKLPEEVEVTLYMTPLDEDEDPVELKRIISIPVAPLSAPWN